MDDVLRRLLEAHVEEELSSWRGERLAGTLTQAIRGLFSWFADVTLEQVVTPEQIARVIERYVIDLRVSGGITELSGEMSRVVFKSHAADTATLEQILTRDMFDEFADKILALESVRQYLIGMIAQSGAVHTLSAHVIARGVLDLLALPLPVARLAPAAVSSVASKVKVGVAPALERLVEGVLTLHRERAERDGEEPLLEVLDPQQLRSVVDEVWDRVGPMRLSQVFELLEEQDIEDFVVLVYEFWLRYRKTDFFRRVSSEVIAYFFEKYGATTLLAIAEDMGVTERMVCETALELLRPMFDQAAASGALERAIRARLEAFYGSAAAQRALAGDGVWKA
jgi:hypothetical protein